MNHLHFLAMAAAQVIGLPAILGVPVPQNGLDALDDPVNSPRVSRGSVLAPHARGALRPHGRRPPALRSCMPSPPRSP